jgi:site-specific DNA recombinase
MNLSLLYVRVSTKEQAQQGFSLEGQEKECRKFAYNNGFEVEKVFVERGESAKTQNRTELQKLIKYVVENKKKLSSIIIWKYDRLARNLSDQMQLVKKFSSLGITVLSATENNDETSVGRLMRNIIGSFAQYENDLKSERTKNGMMQAVKQGRWCWRAPVGYENDRDDKNKPIIIPSDKSRFIVEAFELAESGLYKQTEILAKLKKKGFKELTKNRLNRILRNPLYAGLIKTPWLQDYIDAIHKPIVSKDMFFKVQLFLNGKRQTITPRVRNHPDFPLRNFIRCPKCGQKLTGGWSTGRKKVRYAYYHCRTKGCSLCVRKEDLETKFYEYLRSFQPNEETLALFEAVILDVWKTRQTERIEEQCRLEKELKALEEKRDKIEELLIEGTFDEDTYKRKSEELKNEILVKRIELNEEKIELNDIEACLNYCKFFLANIADLWANADLALKQRFQILIFPEEIYYEGESFKTARTALIFKELQEKNLAEYSLASPTGFEPVLPP